MFLYTGTLARDNCVPRWRARVWFFLFSCRIWRVLLWLASLQNSGQTITVCQCKHCLTQHVERVWSPKHKPTTPNMSQMKVAKRIRNTLRLTVLAYVSLACWDRLALARVARVVLFDISVRVYGLSFFVLSCARVCFVTCWCLMSFYLRKRFCSILTLACGRPPYNLPIFSYLTWVGVIIRFRFPYTLKALAAGRLFVYTPYPRAVFSLHFKAFNTVWLIFTDQVDESRFVLNVSFLARKWKINADFV